jgi:hypothetical protein
LVPDLELASGAGLHHTDAFDTAYRRSLGPFSSSHVHLGMVDPESLDFDHRVAGLRLGIRNLFDYQMFNATKSVSDDRAHNKTSNFYLESRTRATN